MSSTLFGPAFDATDAARLASFRSAVCDRIVDVGATPTLADPNGNEFRPHRWGVSGMTNPADDYRPSPSQRVSEQVRLYEATDGAEGGTLEGRPVVILTHTGARSGAIRKTPIMRIPDEDGYLAVASAAGAAQHPAWYFNLIGHPAVHVQDHATQLDLIARELSGAENQRAWTVAESFWPHFPAYRASAGDREIPILRLEPDAGHRG